jgi:two-component system sensor histidine kinase KdpD
MAVRDRSTELSRENRRELLEIIDEESDRLNRFIEGLSTSDPKQAALPIQLQAVRLEDVVQAALVRAENITRDHHLTVELDSSLPAVSVEPASIVEVIYMLLDNASKYAPVGSHISVVGKVVDDRFVQVMVSDQGPGIPSEFRDRVFEKFFRVPARESHDHRRGGIGLGLPIARRLVEAQAGRIWVDQPPPEGGTSVAMALPVALHEELEHEAAPMAAAR